MTLFKAVRGTAAVRGIFAFLAAALTATAAPAQVAVANATVVQAVSASAVQIGSGQVSTPATVLAQAPLALAGTMSLTALVALHAAEAMLDEQTNCLAVAVYHEARGESLAGQLAVAEVIINRARSDRYPSTWCEVVRQPWQFSFVRNGRMPGVDTRSESWTRARAIARIAAGEVASQVDSDVLWYHADYVSPSWGKRLKVVEKIGTHIFYRA